MNIRHSRIAKAPLVFVLLLSLSCAPSGGATETPQPSPTNTPQIKVVITPEATAAPQIGAKNAQSAAQLAFEQWAQNRGVPYKDVAYEVLSSDGTYATVYIQANFRASAESAWAPYETTIECKNVGGNWTCDMWMTFEEVYVPPPPTWRAYVTRVWVGDEAQQVLMGPVFKYTTEYGATPDSGWKQVAVEIAFENISGTWAIFDDIVAFDVGTLMDSGGYTRDLHIDARIFCSECLDGDEMPMPPGFRLATLAWAHIPESYEPASVLIELPGIEGPYEIDMRHPTTGLKLPVESVPTNIHIAQVGDSFVFEDRTVTITNVRIASGEKNCPDSLAVQADFTFENTGGYGLPVFEEDVYMTAIDNHGHYAAYCNMQTVEDPGILDSWSDEVAPGQMAKGSKGTNCLRHSREDVETIWLILGVRGMRGGHGVRTWSVLEVR